jgi:hypothetical protein
MLSAQTFFQEEIFTLIKQVYSQNRLRTRLIKSNGAELMLDFLLAYINCGTYEEMDSCIIWFMLN